MGCPIGKGALFIGEKSFVILEVNRSESKYLPMCICFAIYAYDVPIDFESVIYACVIDGGTNLFSKWKRKNVREIVRRKTGEPQEERIPDINIDQRNQNMACRTPGCNGTFVPIRAISEGLGGAIKIVIACNGCKIRSLTFDSSPH